MIWIKNFTLVTIVTIVTFETLSFLATKLELFLINDIPMLYASEGDVRYKDISYGRTQIDEWGAWHTSSSTFQHKKNSCFDVTMTFNEVGARDDSFQNTPSSALILLGDSFAEGYGVAREEVSEYLIEKDLEVPILNLGAAGDIGPLQELLIYENFKDLPHQGVIVYIFPYNDFTDNDLEVWRSIDQTRYRPYFSLEGDPLIPYYFPTAIPQDNFLSPTNRGLKEFIKKYFWSSNALRTVNMMRNGGTFNMMINEAASITESFYYDASVKQQSNLVIAHEAILNLAGSRNVLFVVIPSINDITRKDNELTPNSYQNTYWFQSFIDFQSRTEQRVEVLDLMEHLPETTNEIFFDCDGHWSPSGNAWSADIISDFIRSEKLFEIGN